MACALLVALFTSLAAAFSGEDAVVVYSPHGEELERDMKARFEAAHPGIEVKILDLPAAQILERLRAEQDRPAADVWWGGVAADFQRAEHEGLLAPHRPAWHTALPPGGFSPNGFWHALYRTPAVLMYNRNKLKREEVPATWDALLLPEWHGKIVIRDVRPSGTMKTIFSSIVWREWKRNNDPEAGFHWLAKLHWNTGAYASDPQAMYEMLMGQNELCIAPWNMPDVFLQRDINKLPFEFVIPEDAPAPFDPLALVAGGPHPENGKRFLEFVSSTDELLFAAEKYNRLPARTDLPKERLPAWMKDLEFKPLDVDWNEVQRYQDAWIDIWYRTIKSDELPGGGGKPRWGMWLAIGAVAVALGLIVRKRREDQAHKGKQ
ncbi:MAG: extracellular solute-binding protein [Planctomycetota bacterium]|nr:extracellular solute-binding protein [Planctomycetota bacterium]